VSVEPAPESATARAIEEDAERLAGAIYGTIVVTGVLIATADVGEGGTVDAVRAAGYAVVTTVVFWLAHGWSLALAHRLAGAPGTSVRAALRREWPMVLSVVPPIAVMAVAVLLGADDEEAISAAVWVSVAILAAIGGGVARRENASAGQIVLAALGSAALGGLMVLLKVLVH
jgi:hypothetical protein